MSTSWSLTRPLLVVLGGVIAVLAASGCAPSYGPLELSAREELAIATIPFAVTYARRVTYDCDTENKVNPCSKR
jgi:hypothetical protein